MEKMENMWLFKSVIVSPFLLAQVLFLIIRGDEWNWGLVFVPLLALLLICLGMTLFLFSRAFALNLSKGQKIHHGFNLAWVVCAILFASFITAGLAYGDWPWAAIFTPVWVALIFAFAYIVLNYKKDMLFTFVWWILAWAHAVVLSVLLAIQLEEYAWDWGIVFVPAWSFLLLWIVAIIYRTAFSGKKFDPVEISVEVIVLASLIAFMVLLVVNLDKVGHSISRLSLYSPLLVCFAATFLIPYFNYVKKRSSSSKIRRGRKIVRETEEDEDESDSQGIESDFEKRDEPFL
jgi:hypothetical protein